MTDFEKTIQEIEPELISLRRYFHQHPEVAWNEYGTQKKIMEILDREGIPYETPYKTAVLGTIRGKNAGSKILGIRADIDALPIQEEVDCPFKSDNDGVMHACGHDTHISILLASAIVLNRHKEELGMTIRLIFQPAEEFIEDSGAYHLKTQPLVKECDRIIGLHIWSNVEEGYASLMDGPIMASADTFDIYIKGVGGHGAHPEQAVDPISAGVEFCQSVNRLTARELNPLSPSVISITSFNSGTTSNVIPETAHLSGTTRSADPALRDQFETLLNRIAAAVASDTRTEIKVDYHWGCAVTVNDHEVAETGRKAAASVFGEDHLLSLPFNMGGEDFSKYTNPKAFLILGGGYHDPSRRYMQHSPHFEIDESALINGVRYFCAYVNAWEEELERMS